MTCQNNFTLPASLLEQIPIEGFDVLPGLIRIIDNPAVSVRSLIICFFIPNPFFKHSFFECRIPTVAAPTPPAHSFLKFQPRGPRPLADSLSNSVI